MTQNTQDDSSQEMQRILDEMEFETLRRGEIVEGTVMRADLDGIFLDIGHKEEGFIPPNEMRTIDAEELKSMDEGDQLIAFILRPDSQDGPILSVDRAKGEEGWRELQKFLEADLPVEGRIAGFNRGGCILEVENVQGFVPMSQLITISREQFAMSEDSESSEHTSELIGSTLTVKVLEVNRSRNRAIFSERSALKEQREEQKAILIEQLQEGDIRKGRVTGVSSFGAFVDLGGADGLIHISELSWGMVTSPDEIVNVGEEIDVFILRIDRDTMKIALSLRKLYPEPWETIHERYNVGDVVDATVTKLADFGAFARLEDSIEGLIHITEMGHDNVAHPGDVIAEGDSVQVTILRIESDRRRLGLSLKQSESVDEEPTSYTSEE